MEMHSMRNLAVSFVVLLGCAFALAEKNLPLDELIRRADEASPSSQATQYMEIAEHQLQSADKLYSSGDTAQAQKAVSDVVAFAGKATNAAKQTGSHLKHTEIHLRTMAERLRAIKRTLAFDDQKPVQDAADNLEGMRNEILSRMFAPPKKRKK